MHHPVMLEAVTGPYPVDPVYLTEWNGLKVPAGFDCNMFIHTLPADVGTCGNFDIVLGPLNRWLAHFSAPRHPLARGCD